MTILSIETSCDETSIGILADGKLISNNVFSQDFHKRYGGVVPELSSRAHIQRVLPLIKDSFSKSGLTYNDIDIIAATAGPGLIGALMVGFTFAKGLALAQNKEFVPVNHIEGHLFSGFLMEEQPQFPFLCLVVSGGHTLLFYVESFIKFTLVGSTIDDAAGEAFDKVAKLLGLEYPGGPNIQKYAAKGDASKIDFPIAQVKGKFDYSFSGLKTSVLRYVQKQKADGIELDEQLKADIAAAFQESLVFALLKKAEKALKEYPVKGMCLVGGVAANSYLRERYRALGQKYNKQVVIPDLQFCGDNGAMIAFRAYSLKLSGQSFPLDYEAYPSFKSDYLVV